MRTEIVPITFRYMANDLMEVKRWVKQDYYSGASVQQAFFNVQQSIMF